MIDYILSKPVNYAKDGMLEPCQAMVLVAPSAKLLRKTYRLQQLLLKAMFQARESFNSTKESEGGKEEEVKLTGKQVMAMLLASDVDIGSCIDEFKALAISGCLKIGEMNVNVVIFDQIEESDKEGLMAAFIANFIVTLVMNNLKES